MANVLHWFVYVPERGERAKWALLFRHDRSALNCMNSEIIVVDWDHCSALRTRVWKKPVIRRKAATTALRPWLDVTVSRV